MAQRITKSNKGVMSILSRLIKYMFEYYKLPLIIVLICITLNSMAAISSSIFIERIVNDVITPGIANGWDSVKDKLLTIIGIMIGIYCRTHSLVCIYQNYGARYAGIFVSRPQRYVQ